MKKTYVNPRIRVVEIECGDGIALNVLSDDATNQNGSSRRERPNAWDDEEEW